MPIDIHCKVGRVQVSSPLVHSLEHRIALLAARFAALEQRAAQVPISVTSAKPAVAVKKVTTNPEWEPCKLDTPEVATIRALTKQLSLATTKFTWVPSEYYNQKLQWRKEKLGAPTVQHLCKAIVLENTHCANSDCSDPRNSRYYVAVFQYVRRFDAEKVMRFAKGMNEGIGKKKFNFRLAENAADVTGFSYNAVVPFGLKTPMPIILAADIVALEPRQFWMGGGHVDCKLRIDTDEFLEHFKPFVADITVPYSEEELATL
jgi:prolyl-tRNA editing enzyme YbaK/EbsC (Cys-tRNA(Pro) deacylase)